ncbi:MAG: DUF6152 family protein [Hyphomicrobiaceae bacterium]
MLMRVAAAALLVAVAAIPLRAHHGWGSYDAAKLITVKGNILDAKYENPHVTLKVQAPEKTWTVTLAPTSRMINRGALKEMVAVGKTISADGYPSKTEKDELRAERIAVDGKTIEMR